MKIRLFRFSLGLALWMLAAWPIASVAAAEGPAEEKDIAVFVNGEELTMEHSPVVVDGTTLVPLRDLFAELDIAVEWNDEQDTITAEREGLEVVLEMNKETALLKQDGEVREMNLSEPVRQVGEATMIPLRLVSTGFGDQVKWDGEHHRINIRSKAAWDEEETREYADYLDFVVQERTETGVSIEPWSYEIIMENGYDMFARSRDTKSLSEEAEAEGSGIVRLSDITIVNKIEKQIDVDEYMTVAVGAISENRDASSETSAPETEYVHVFFIGKTDIEEGKRAELMGVAVGETTYTTEKDGKQTEHPAYVLIAGNLYAQ